jgi:hypothetical protein
MRESIKNRAAAIRQYVDKRDLPADPATIYRYSVTAAQWEATRLLIDKGKGTAADDRRFAELSDVLRTLSRQVGLGDELTMSSGFLPSDPSRIICETWQEAAEGW